MTGLWGGGHGGGGDVFVVVVVILVLGTKGSVIPEDDDGEVTISESAKFIVLLDAMLTTHLALRPNRLSRYA